MTYALIAIAVVLVYLCGVLRKLNKNFCTWATNDLRRPRR